MIKTILKSIVIFSLPLVFSCSGDTASNTTNSETIDSTQEGGGMPEAPATHTAGAKIDPVCEMEKEDTWTEFSVYKGDTVWFCGAGCKQAFDARPEKYKTKG